MFQVTWNNMYLPPVCKQSSPCQNIYNSLPVRQFYFESLTDIFCKKLHALPYLYAEDYNCWHKQKSNLSPSGLFFSGCNDCFLNVLIVLLWRWWKVITHLVTTRTSSISGGWSDVVSGRELSLAMALWIPWIDRNENGYLYTSVLILRASFFILHGNMTPGQIPLPTPCLVRLPQSPQTRSIRSALSYHVVGHLHFPSSACLELRGLASLPVANILGGE